MRVIYVLILCAVIMATCCAAFYLGVRFEEANRYSVAQQFRGWSTLASLASRSPVPTERLREKYELIYFFETRALAANLENLGGGEVLEFRRAVGRLSDVVTDNRLHGAAVALSSCVERNAPGKTLIDCLNKDVPTVDVGAFADRKATEVNSG